MSASNAIKQGADQGARLASAIERVIRPFIKLIVGRVSCGFLVQQVKRIYIEEARSWIRKNDPHGRVTKSKLAMLTGLDTRTISSFEASIQDSSELTVADICPEAGLLEKWCSNEFLDENGQPAILPIMGKRHSFQVLVGQSVGRNVTYQTVLDRLLESGNIELAGENHVRLVNPFFQPVTKSDETVLDCGCMSIGRLTETINHNFNPDNKNCRLLHQDRWSLRILNSELDNFERDMRELIEYQILEAEKLILKYEQPDGTADCSAFGVSWFFFKPGQSN